MVLLSWRRSGKLRRSLIKIPIGFLWLPPYHFEDGLELRTLAHGSTFFCGLSGIAFNFDWYSLSISFLFASIAGSTGLSFDKSIFGWNWANADPPSAIDKAVQLMTNTITDCCRKLIVIMTPLH
jgi:hypothetical protein